MINRHAADFVAFHCHFPAQWATMQVLFRGGTWCFDFWNVTERDYLSLHFTMSLSDGAERRCSRWRERDHPREQRECQATRRSHSDKWL